MTIQLLIEIFAVIKSGDQYIYPELTAVKHQHHNSVSKDLLFSNWLLMYLAGNYCDSDKSSASPGGVVLQRFYKRDHKSDHKIQ